MRIGIGLPNTIPGAPGDLLVEWSRRAEERGFATLATIDRIAYPSYESLASLAAAAAVTERIHLMTDVLLGPTRDPALLAKEAATVDQISAGRLRLGLGVGAREDDYTASGVDFHTRGRLWDRNLEVIHRAWAGEPVEGANKPVAPRPVRGTVPLVFGGMSDRTVARVVRWGVGWTASGGYGPDVIGPFVERLRTAWKDGGRDGSPQIFALVYFAMGEETDVAEASVANITDYYGPAAEPMGRAAVRDAGQLAELVRAYGDAGTEEILFHPSVGAIDQVDRLATAVL